MKASGRPRNGNGVDAARKRALAERLRALMEQQGLSVTEVARRVEKELAGEKFNPVNLSHYKAGRSLPRPRYLSALSKAFGVSTEDLVPPADALAMQEVDAPLMAQETGMPAFRIEDLSDGQAWLQINQRLPWPLALRILEALKGDSIFPGKDELGQG